MKFNRIFSTIAVGAMILGLGACTDEVRYEPSFPADGDEVYFAENATTSFQLLPDATQVDATLLRVKDEDDLAVNLTYTAVDNNGDKVEGLFSVPQTLTFPKGTKEIVVPISYAFDQITPNVDYVVTIKIDGESTSPWGLVEQSYTLSYSPWSEWERYSDDPVNCIMGSPLNQILGSYPQYLYTRKSLINENLVQYMAPDPFSDVDFQFVFEIDKTQSITNENGELCYIVRAPAVDLGIKNGDTSEIFGLQDVYSWYMWVKDYNKTPEQVYAWMAENSYGESTFNTVTGLLSVDYMLFPINMEKGSWYTNTYYYFQFPGYADYSFAFNIVGNFVANNGAESVVLSVVKGADVVQYAIDYRPGKLTEAQVDEVAQAIIDNPEVTTFTENTEVKIPVEEEGTYTVVAVGFDQMMNKVAVDSYEFNFTSVQKENEWEKFGEAEFTDLFAGCSYGEPPFYWTVPAEKHKTIEGFYRLVNPYGAEDSPWKQYLVEPDKNGYLYIHAEDPDAVWFELSYLNVQLGAEGPISAWSMGGFAIQGYDWTLQQAFEQGFTGWLEDGSLYFPPKTLLVVFGDNYQEPYTAGGKDYTAWADPVVTFFNLLPDESNAPAVRNVARKAPRNVNYFDFRKAVKKSSFMPMFSNKHIMSVGGVEQFKRDAKMSAKYIR